MRVVKGDVADLDHGVAITSGFSFDSGVHLGDRLLGAPVVAVVRDAPDLYSDVIAPRSLLPAKYDDTVPELYFVDPGSADLDELVAGTHARVLTADGWIDEVDQQTRAGNNLGLWVLLGPAGLYAAIAIVNSVLVGASQRKAQLRTIALLGATREQLRRMALWEAGLVGAAASPRRRRGHRTGGLDDPHLDLGQRGGATLHAAVAAPRGDRRHVCRADAGRSVGRVSARDQPRARVSARTVSGSSSLSP